MNECLDECLGDGNANVVLLDAQKLELRNERKGTSEKQEFRLTRLMASQVLPRYNESDDRHGPTRAIPLRIYGLMKRFEDRCLECKEYGS